MESAMWNNLGALLRSLIPPAKLQMNKPAQSSGLLDGVRQWTLPSTANGLKPSQSWHAIGSTPSGDIFVGGMDHKTNSALYMLSDNDVIQYVGDARSASEAVGNWKAGETAEKFHTRPIWHDNKVYVATLDRSLLDDGYLSRRGFHWYAYDTSSRNFIDLSASESGGVGAEKCGLVTIALDAKSETIFGASVPKGEIFRYDLKRGRTENLGRPASYNNPFVYAGRFMWVDSDRLYFTAGNPSWGSYDPSVYGHIHYFDIAKGVFGERKDWVLQEPRAIETGQWSADFKHCFLADDAGRIYRFDREGPGWNYLGQVEGPTAQKIWKIWMFQVSADSKMAYLISSAPSNEPGLALYQFELSAGRSRRLCNLADFALDLAPLNVHTGYDSWDQEGRFCFASFNPQKEDNVVITRIDPVRLKTALGDFPILPEVSITLSHGNQITITRTGSVSSEQEVLYRWRPGSESKDEKLGTLMIPPGVASQQFGLKDLLAGRLPGGGVLSIVPNGNDYVRGKSGSAVIVDEAGPSA